MLKEIDRIIEVKGVGKRVADVSGELVILDAIDFTVDSGATVAIVGESGSGKSTLLGLLAGLDTVTAGAVHLFGQDLSKLDEDRRAALRKGRVGFVFQSFQLMPHLSALENVLLPLELGALGNGDARRQRHNGTAANATPANDNDFMAAHGEPLSTAQARERAADLLERVGLGARKDHYPRVLSGGEQQRVALARAFVTAPQLLFADEPTGSLDAANGRAVADLMFEMNRATGATLILVTHDLELARRCDRTITLEAGRLVGGTGH